MPSKTKDNVDLVGLSLPFLLQKDYISQIPENQKTSLNNKLFLVNLFLTDVTEDGLKLLSNMLPLMDLNKTLTILMSNLTTELLLPVTTMDLKPLKELTNLIKMFLLTTPMLFMVL